MNRNCQRILDSSIASILASIAACESTMASERERTSLCLTRDTDAARSGSFPEGVELPGELGVAVVDQVFRFDFDLEHQQLHPDVVFRQKPVRQKDEKNEQKIEFHIQSVILNRTHILLISI